MITINKCEFSNKPKDCQKHVNDDEKLQIIKKAFMSQSYEPLKTT